jgi:hypothetical protein
MVYNWALKKYAAKEITNRTVGSLCTVTEVKLESTVEEIITQGKMGRTCRQNRLRQITEDSVELGLRDIKGEEYKENTEGTARRILSACSTR